MPYSFSTQDQRTTGGPLSIDLDRVSDISLMLGFPEHTETTIELEVRLSDMPEGDGPYRGRSDILYDPSPEKVGFFCEVYVIGRENFSEAALYALNNALCHEMRHIAQAITGYPGRSFANEIDAVQFARLAHRPAYCAISGGKSFDAISFVCSVCGEVTATALPDGKTAYQHASASCSGEVAMVMELPSD